MKRVLLFLEDYNEMLFIEGLLKKLGFDVESARTQRTFEEKNLGMLPEVIVATGGSAKFDVKAVMAQVQRLKVKPKLIMFFPRKIMEKGIDLHAVGADGAVERPVQPRTFLKALCRITGVDEEAVMKKFNRLPLSGQFSKEDTELMVITGRGAHAAISDRERRYARFVSEAPASPFKQFNHSRIEKEVEAMRSAKDEEESELNRLRQDFVRKLYKK